MKNTDLDYPSVLRSTDEYEQVMAEQMRREAEARPTVGSGVALVVAFGLAFAAMFVVALIVEVMP